MKPEQAAESPKATFALEIQFLQAGLVICVCGLNAHVWIKAALRLHSGAYGFHFVEPEVLFARAFAAFDADSPVLDRLLGGFGI